MSQKSSFSVYDLFMLILCIYVMIALLVETFFDLPGDVQEILLAVDFGICVVFLLDFFVNFLTKGVRYLKWGWIDLISSIPMVGPLRLGRMVRIVRILRLFRGIRSLRRIGHVILIHRERSIFLAAALLTLFTLIFGAVAILQFERDAEGANIQSGGDALWWAFVTITTVGYGDRYPITLGGRIVAGILMIVGIGLFGTFAGMMASWFVEGHKKTAPETVENDLEN